MVIFISHISEEVGEAAALKAAVETALPSVRAFVSGADIRLGQAWLKQIDTALSEAVVVVALCSERSIRRPWVNFECGTGWTRGLPIIPVCHRDLDPANLPDPLHVFQGVQLSDPEACGAFIERLAEVTGLRPAADFSPDGFLKSLRVQRPARGGQVGIVSAHRQREWDDGPETVFSIPDRFPAQLTGQWDVHELVDERPFQLDSLHALRGLVFPSPWRARISPECIAATIDWVMEGGRILFLGFELGDYHHNANLSQLTQWFGIDPSCDIVGPP